MFIATLNNEFTEEKGAEKMSRSVLTFRGKNYSPISRDLK